VTGFRRFRLAEYIALAWMALAAFAYFRFGDRGLRLFDVYSGFNPMLALLLCVLCRYLVDVVHEAARGLAVTVRLLGEAPVAVSGFTLDWTRETAVLRSMLRFLRDVGPLLLSMLFYPATNVVTDWLQGGYLADAWLARLDVMLFGGHWTVYMEPLISPILTDVLSFCYFAHVLLPTIVFVFLYLRAPYRLFAEAIQGFFLLFVIGFFLYVVVPAVGPKYELAHLYQRDLQGGLIGELNRTIIDLARIKRDAFPSLHVGLSAILLLYAWRASRTFTLVLFPVILGNWIATIYLRYHYTIDVLAGFLLVPLVDILVRAWMKGEDETMDERPPEMGANDPLRGRSVSDQ
jgi:membrane-associated phospholipid phosphatase